MNLKSQEISGLIFNVQRFSIHDGPGIRTTVFLKGCPLRCFWCHNPEGLDLLPALQYWDHRCTRCGACVTVCPDHLHHLESGAHRIDRERCTACFRCVDQCYSGALEPSGRRVRISELLPQLLADQPFFAASGGGVTLSGGEPLMQPQFSRALLQACKEAGVHTTVQTCAATSWTHLRSILAWVDLFLIDIKVLDPMAHKQCTGQSNRRILENIRRLAETPAPLVFRIPVIPGVNDRPETIAEIARFVSTLRTPALTVELVPFHRLATDKYRSLGWTYQAADLCPLSTEAMDSLRAAARI
mgnify:CR=1 FL=1